MPCGGLLVSGAYRFGFNLFGGFNMALELFNGLMIGVAVGVLFFLMLDWYNQ